MLENAKRNLMKVGVKVAKRKPEIMLGFGLASIVTGAVYIGTSSVKAVHILDERKELLTKIEEAKHVSDEALDDATAPELYSDKDAKADLVTVNVQTGVKLCKLYLPAAGLILGGVGLILGSHREMSNRYKSLLAAYNTVDKSYKLLKEKMRSTALQQTEDGVEPAAELEEEAFAYSVVFDANNPNWRADSDYNYLYIQNAERYFNDLLKSRGHVFLNEVYDALGFPHTKEGAIVGWVYDTGVDHTTHNCVTLNMYDEEWFMGCESSYNSIFIDFNVDGVIYDLI